MSLTIRKVSVLVFQNLIDTLIINIAYMLQNICRSDLQDITALILLQFFFFFFTISVSDCNKSTSRLQSENLRNFPCLSQLPSFNLTYLNENIVRKVQSSSTITATYFECFYSSKIYCFTTLEHTELNLFCVSKFKF